jgi:hypothetical protein
MHVIKALDGQLYRINDLQIGPKVLGPYSLLNLVLKVHDPRLVDQLHTETTTDIERVEHVNLLLHYLSGPEIYYLYQVLVSQTTPLLQILDYVQSLFIPHVL